MGQRHQAFVIARVRPHGADPSAPPRYRCIAAFHHQWCYGRLPLLATHRFITQVKKPDHADIIRSEIDAIHGQPAGEAPHIPAVPCPFIAFLLATTWSVDLENADVAYASGVSFSNAILPAGMDSGGGDNNDGISVIDVTDPLSPSYCFVSLGGLEACAEVPSWVPLSAKEYARAYYPEYIPNPEATETEAETTKRVVDEDVQEKIALLKDVKIVDLEMLAEAWPNEYDFSETPKKDKATEAETQREIPSLVELTLKPAVTHAVTTGETKDIETMLWMPGKASGVKAALREQSPFPDAGLTLLAKAIDHELEVNKTKLDLSGFSLSSSQIEKLVSTIGSIEILDLSRNPVVTIDAVRAVLTALPQLKRLVLLNCPTISVVDIRSLLDAEPKLFYHLEALIHPALLAELKDASVANPYRNAFSHIGHHNHHLKACSLPFFTPSRVIQALTDILQPLCKKYGSYSMLQTSLAMQAAFAAVRAPDQKWSERSTVIIPQLSLGAFQGEGWAFVLEMDSLSRDGAAYAFLRVNVSPAKEKDSGIQVDGEDASENDSDAASPPVSSFEICDLSSFLEKMAQDGRPPPTNEAVKKLQDILTILAKEHGMKLMSEKRVKAFIENALSSVSHLY